MSRPLRLCAQALVLASLVVSVMATREPTASLRGTVTDSIRHGPLVGATVVVSPNSTSIADASDDYTARTDAKGRCAIKSLPPGAYLVTVEHPWLDSTGLGVPAKPVELVRQRTATVNLAVPSGPTIRSAFCPVSARDSSSGLVAGYVTDTRSNHPISGAGRRRRGHRCREGAGADERRAGGDAAPRSGSGRHGRDQR